MEKIELTLTEPVDNLCDFTYGFYWETKKTSPEAVIPCQQDTRYTYRELVETLKRGGEVHIHGDVGARLAYSLGADIKHLGGSGGIVSAGSLVVEGDAGVEAGMGMVSGTLYVSGRLAQPVGNIVEVASDREGFRKYRSITDILRRGLGGDLLVENRLDEGRLVLSDGVPRGTLCARLDVDARVVVEGDVYNGTGLLMSRGVVHVKGNAGMNTGAHLRGGTVIVEGSVGEFTGAYMHAGCVIISGEASYVGANMTGGSIYAPKKVKPAKPARAARLSRGDIALLREHLHIGYLKALSYRKYEVAEEPEFVRMKDGTMVRRMER
jgi:formylmethanofuran dehydrogenase subunit C